MPIEEQKKLYGTTRDMRPSKFDADPSADSHLTKIPTGQVFKLQELLKQFPNATDQKNIRAYFNSLFGKGKAEAIGY